MGEDTLNEDVYGHCKVRTGRLRVRLQKGLIGSPVSQSRGDEGTSVESDGQLGEQGAS